MSDQSKPLSGKQVVSLPALARSVSLVSACAAVIFYQVVIGFPDAISMLMVYLPALAIGALVGLLAAILFPRHGSGGILAAVGTALIVASLISVVFILIARFGFGYDGHFPGLAGTLAIPCIIAGTIWAVLVSAARPNANNGDQ